MEKFRKAIEPFFQELKKRKLKLTRVRIIRLPLSEYLKYELDLFRVNASLGERILALGYDDFRKFAKDSDTGDFVMFDDKIVLRNFFNVEGRLISYDVLKERHKVAPYVALKKRLLAKAVPLNRFMAVH